MTTLSDVELAELAGAAPERIRQLADLGILASQGDGELSFQLGDIQRVRMADALERAGVSLEDLGRAIESGELSFSFLDRIFPEPAPLSRTTYRELAEELDLPLELLERIQIGFGLPRPSPDDLVRQDDAAVLRMVVTIVGAGLSEEEVTHGVRVYGENVRRIAQFQVDLFHSHFEEPIRQQTSSEVELLEHAAEVSMAVRPVAEHLVGWLFKRHREHYSTEHLVMHAEKAMEQAGLFTVPPPNPPALSFLDLTGFTRVTESEGDEVAAELAVNLAQLVQEASARHGGSVVKWVGDGVMFYFDEPEAAVISGLELVEIVPRSGLPPAHVGISAGPVIFREGDYFGRTVNLAARISGAARAGEVLVSEEVVTATRTPELSYREIGPVDLKGIAEPLTLFVATREPARATDQR